MNFILSLVLLVFDESYVFIFITKFETPLSTSTTGHTGEWREADDAQSIDFTL